GEPAERLARIPRRRVSPAQARPAFPVAEPYTPQRPRPPGPPREFVAGEAVSAPRPPHSESGPHPSVVVADELLRAASERATPRRRRDLQEDQDLRVERRQPWIGVGGGARLARGGSSVS